MGKLAAVVTLLMLNSAAIAGVLLLASGRNPTNDLVTLLSAPICATACWEGIQPLVTHRRVVRDYLDQQGIEFDVAMSAVDRDTYIWTVGDSFPLADTQATMLVSVEFGLGDGIVWRIALHNINVCASTVIGAYGIPAIGSEDTFNIRLGYPDKGLMFGVRKDTGRVTGLFIISGEWVHYFVEPTPVNWEAILDASRLCRDRLW
jgi:hypothetical protein